MFLSTGLSWPKRSDGHCFMARRSITRMAILLTTIWTISNCGSRIRQPGSDPRITLHTRKKFYTCIGDAATPARKKEQVSDLSTGGVAVPVAMGVAVVSARDLSYRGVIFGRVVSRRLAPEPPPQSIHVTRKCVDKRVDVRRLPFMCQTLEHPLAHDSRRRNA